jgi:prefoldin subunit 5
MFAFAADNLGYGISAEDEIEAAGETLPPNQTDYNALLKKNKGLQPLVQKGEKDVPQN